MHTLTRGQKSKLADFGLPTRLELGIELQAPGSTADISCFGIDASERLSDERYMVFYNQLSAPANEITLALTPGRATFQIDLERLPPSISKLVFTAALDGGGTMRSIGQAKVRLGDSAEFSLTGADFASEKAVILGELYRKDGAWRFGAVGQGFDGGMAALLKHFCGVEATPASASQSAPVARDEAPGSKVSLSKITLEKRGDKVSLEKRHAAGFGRVHVNLNWNQRQADETGRSFLGRMLGSSGPRSVDLDLGCLYELSDGTPGVVQALGKRWGSFDQLPYICLEGDDRSGTSAGGENMYVNGDCFDRIRRVLIFAFIYEGVANWAQTDGVVTLRLPDQPTVEVRLDNGTAKGMCAIAMIENRDGQLQVTKLAEYVGDHRELDLKYSFGLRWKVGSKN
jgi:tellurite resistance protein TerA